MSRLASALLIAGIAMAGCASNPTTGPAAAQRQSVDPDAIVACMRQAASNSRAGNPRNDGGYSPNAAAMDAEAQAQLCRLQQGAKAAR